ncbi:uncharacterized protein RHIMIDRAFT_316136 [Rhizopus microsporus ATCC 52813]|uniref:Uncharacterized protein n=1 Tax=Rhizopus microsporus ATCC 52813 TaxID=1340429 RepID=A0A2G4SJ29_RHIZD|nr:uncharacterized protein RHIMIDRAFT_316136 [Rhizopus microsporus ATCC 52813]PHZ08406.1 hypothetical protein RHIMIDRAFT_316136 [Rhizopus microsporus ATCC 52813]
MIPEKVALYEDLEICHAGDSLQPLLFPHVRINSNPFDFCKYSSEADIVSQEIQEKINVNFISESSKVSSKDIFSLVMLYTTRFDEKSLLSFIKWCNIKKVLYMNQEQERKVLKDQNGSKVRFQVLWTLKNDYLNGTTLSITEHLPKYQAYVKNLKKNNFTVIGYARKSPGQVHQEVRVGLIQKMVNKLYDTLLVDKVFVSTSSRANDTI